MPGERLRVQLDLYDRDVDRIDSIKKLLGAASRAEVIRNAVLLFENAIRFSQKEGLEVICPDGKTRIFMIPGLPLREDI